MFWAFVLAQAVAPADPPPLIGKELHDQIVSAIRNCPQAKGDEIAVCSKDRGYAERYRLEKLQKPLAPVGTGGIQFQLASPDTGAAGTGSCTATGAGGSAGCSAKDYDAWAAWKRQHKTDGQDYPW